MSQNIDSAITNLKYALQALEVEMDNSGGVKELEVTIRKINEAIL